MPLPLLNALAEPTVPSLRDYQVEAVEALREGIRQGRRRQVLSAPTGAGKTRIAAHMMASALEKGRKSIFVVDRIALVHQTSAALDEAGLPHGIVQASTQQDRKAPIQVVSSPTAERRGFFPECDLVFWDEAHIRRAKLAEYCANTTVPVIGLTATPLSPGMAEDWDNVVTVRTTNELIADGWIAPMCVYAPAAQVDTAGLKVQSTGEYVSSELSERVMHIVGNVVEDWINTTKDKFGGPVKTIVFSASVADGARLCEEFRARGHQFEQISYLDTDTEERNAKIEAHRRGDIMGLISCEALQRGYDVPDIQCVVDTHSYFSSLGAVLQQYGRGMRAAPGKTDCLLMDHGTNYLRWEPKIRDFWENGVTKLLPSSAKKEPGLSPEEIKDRPGCPNCGFLPPDPGWMTCPFCNYEMPRPRAGKGRVVRLFDGKLRKLREDGTWSPVRPDKPKEPEKTPLSKTETWRQLIAYAAIKGKEGDAARRWCQANYKAIYGGFARKIWKPDDAWDGPLNPDLIAKVKKQQAAWAIRRKYGAKE